MLLHVFFHEAVIACALVAFGYELAWKEGVTTERLWESTCFLAKLIRKEYFTADELNKDYFQNLLITIMTNQQTLEFKDNKIRVTFARDFL